MLCVPQSAYLRGALGLCLALSVPATLSAGAAQAQTKIITGMVAHGPPQWPQYIATELGWLKQDNIELDFVTAGGGGAQQLAAGALDICHSGYPDFARASLQGAPVKIIVNDIVASPYAVFAKPAIKRIADLKGKLMSIGGNNDITFIYIKPFLASAGLKTSDVDFIFAKARPETVSPRSSPVGSTPRSSTTRPIPRRSRSGSQTSATPSPMQRISLSRCGPPTCLGPRRTKTR